MAQLEAVKTQRFREEKLRQSIRENSSELRDLEQKLNYAYMNKERALQLKERELLLKKEKVHSQISDLQYKCSSSLVTNILDG